LPIQLNQCPHSSYRYLGNKSLFFLHLQVFSFLSIDIPSIKLYLVLCKYKICTKHYGKYQQHF